MPPIRTTTLDDVGWLFSIFYGRHTTYDDDDDGDGDDDKLIFVLSLAVYQETSSDDRTHVELIGKKTSVRSKTLSRGGRDRRPIETDLLEKG